MVLSMVNESGGCIPLRQILIKDKDDTKRFREQQDGQLQKGTGAKDFTITESHFLVH